MKSLYEVPGLSPSNIEELKIYPGDILDRALAALRKKGTVDFPFTYLRRVCEIFTEEKKKKPSVSSPVDVEPFVATQRREDQDTGAVRMQAFRVTPMYKRLESQGFHPITDGLGCIWKDQVVDPLKVSAMIDIELQYHTNGDKLCPLSQEMAKQTINECPFYELAMTMKEKDEVRN
jgi:hypothetical protein